MTGSTVSSVPPPRATCTFQPWPLFTTPDFPMSYKGGVCASPGAPPNPSSHEHTGTPRSKSSTRMSQRWASHPPQPWLKHSGSGSCSGGSAGCSPSTCGGSELRHLRDIAPIDISIGAPKSFPSAQRRSNTEIIVRFFQLFRSYVNLKYLHELGIEEKDREISTGGRPRRAAQARACTEV